METEIELPSPSAEDSSRTGHSVLSTRVKLKIENVNKRPRHVLSF